MTKITSTFETSLLERDFILLFFFGLKLLMLSAIAIIAIREGAKPRDRI